MHTENSNKHNTAKAPIQSDQQRQIEQLETKVAYLEHHIEQLNDALVTLQLDNKTAKDALKYLYQQVQSIGGSQGSQNSDNFIEPPPPHY
jgi:SlyX protein